MPWLQGSDIDLANRRRNWLRLIRPLRAGPDRRFPLWACLHLKRLRLPDCKSGSWRLLSGQTLPDGVALVAVAGGRWQKMAPLWCRLSPDQWLHKGLIPRPAHRMDHPCACCSHRQAGQAEPECLLSMGTRHSLADAAAALTAQAGQGAVPEFLWAAMFAAAPMAAIEP